MPLTFPPGPLSGRPPQSVNYRIEGPAHRLLMQDFPRRVRAVFGGRTVASKTWTRLLKASHTQTSRSSGVRPTPWLGQPCRFVGPVRKPSTSTRYSFFPVSRSPTSTTSFGADSARSSSRRRAAYTRSGSATSSTVSAR